MAHREFVLALIFASAYCCGAVRGADGDQMAATEANVPVFQSWPPEPNAAFPEPAVKTDAQKKEQVASVQNAASFRRLGRHLYTAPGAGVIEERTALIFANAALSLDPFGEYAMEDFLYLKTTLNEREDWPVMRRLLMTHLEQRRDIEVARAMVRYLLEDKNSREEREQALADLFNIAKDKNKELASDIAAEHGILTAERGDVRGAAARYLTAYRLHPFNVLALAKLSEAAPDELTPVFHASDLRLGLTRNPLDLSTSLALAAFMGKYGSWRAAARAYEYSAELHEYLYPQQPLPVEITRPWALCCYNQGGRMDKCIEIAEAARASGRFDVVLEGIAQKAAEKEGFQSDAQAIAARVEEKLSQPGGNGADDAARTIEKAAWYYAFCAKDGGKALSWANRAYAAEPNSPTARALLVYALVINGQGEVAAEMMKEAGSGDSDQIVQLAMGVKLLAEQKKEEAIAALKKAVTIRPDTIEAAEARDLLAYNGETYSGIDQDVVTGIATELKNIYGDDIVPQWMSPERLVSVKLISRMDSAPSFDSDVKIELSITNNWSGSLMVGHGGLVGGNLRVDGELQGDVRRMMPALVSRQIGPWSVLAPGKSMVIPLDMNLNGIYDALREYPQANLSIVFTAYLDPVTEGGVVRNSIAGVSPGKVTIERRPVKPTRELISNRLDALGKGYQTQKVQAARMFTSLLRERAMIDAGTVKYNAMKLEPSLLKSAIIRALDDEDQTVKAETMAAMDGIEMDYDLTAAVAEGLKSKYWPTRLISIYLLGSAPNNDFDKVLKWYIENDNDGNVRKMAEILMNRRQAAQLPAQGHP